MKFKYKKGDHLFLCGKTGTGKSYGLIKLIKTYLKKDFIIFDIKQEDFNNLGCHVVHNYKEFLIALKNKKDKILVQDKNLTSETIEKYLKFLYENCKNFTVIVDELHLLVSKMKISPSMKHILHVGRSKGKSFWGASQRTADIHNSILSQSTHKFSFFLGLLSDRKRMAEELDINIKEFDVLKEYYFFYKLDKGKTPIQIDKF